MVAIIIVNYNGWKDTLECLISISKSEYKDYEVIIVDNGSTNNSFTEFIKWGKQQNNFDYIENDLICFSCSIDEKRRNTYIFLKNNINNGFAAGNNFGINYLISNNRNYVYYWFLNNDTIIRPDTIGNFISRFDLIKESNERIGILGGKLFYYGSESTIQAIGGTFNKVLSKQKHIGAGEVDNGQYDDVNLKMDYIIGASMFVRSEFISEVGLMSEEYFLFYEELDWAFRGKNLGWQVGYEPSAVVYHKEGATIGHDKSIGYKADLHSVVNRVILAKKFFRKYLLTMFPINMAIVFINRIRRGQYKRAIVFPFQMLKTLFFKNSF